MQLTVIVARPSIPSEARRAPVRPEGPDTFGYPVTRLKGASWTSILRACTGDQLTLYRRNLSFLLVKNQNIFS